MAVQITTIQNTNSIPLSRPIINTNFANLKSAIDAILNTTNTNGSIDNTWSSSNSKITTRQIILPASSTGINIGANSTGITIASGNVITITNNTLAASDVMTAAEGNILLSCSVVSDRGLIQTVRQALGHKPSNLASYSTYQYQGDFSDFRKVQEVSSVGTAAPIYSTTFGATTPDNIFVGNGITKLAFEVTTADTHYVGTPDIDDVATINTDICIYNKKVSLADVIINIEKDRIFHRVGDAADATLGTYPAYMSNGDVHTITIAAGGFVKLRKTAFDTTGFLYEVVEGNDWV